MSSVALQDHPATPIVETDVLIAEKSLSKPRLDRQGLERLQAQAESGHIHLTDEGKIDIRNHDLSNLDLRGFNFTPFDVAGCVFTGAQLDRTSLESLLPAARNHSITLRKTDLQGANLEAKFLNRPDIGLATYVPLNLQGIDFQGANFSGSNLKRAMLVGANLNGVDFSSADLSMANAKNTNFQNVNFSNAILSEGDFRNCDFRGAIFKGAVI